MGSNSSKGKNYQAAAKFGEILIKTDKTTYFAGDTVTGRVYIYMLNPYYCKKLVLRLKGKESVHFLFKKEAEKHREYGLLTSGALSDLCEENQIIIDKSELLYDWDSEVKPDAYEIPFSFMIPRELPSTFYQEANGLVANIAYRIEAIMFPCNPKKDPKIKCRQNIVVRQGVKNAQQNVQSSTNTKLTTHRCLSAGSNVLRAYLDKNYYCPGEKALVHIEIDNKHSLLKTKRISVNLKQRINLIAKKKFINRIYNKVTTSLQGPRSGKSNTYSIELPLPSFQGGAASYKKMTPKERAKHLVAILNNTNILNSSVRSNLISSEYYLTITTEMGGRCSESPTLECPIEIYYPEEIDTQEIVAPPGWNPHQMESVNVAFGGPNTQSPQLYAPQLAPSPTIDTLGLTGNMIGGPVFSPQNVPTSHHLMHIPTMPNQEQPQFMPMSQNMMVQPQMVPGMMHQQQPMMMMPQQQPMMTMPQQHPMMMPQQQPMMMPQQYPMMMMPQQSMMANYQRPMAGPTVAVVQGNQNGGQTAIYI